MMSDDLRELYQEIILDHARSPRNHRTIEDATCLAHGNNPICGDTLVIFLVIDNNDLVEDVSFKGDGCAISIASASIMTGLLRGKTKKEAESLFNTFHKMCTEDDFVVQENDDLDRLEILAGIRSFPTRVKCATLAWHTMSAAINNQDKATTE